ncbi:MAG: hypothetical protein Q4C78_00700 [Synergistaceae bacterium]|nr:hypothetical protein [Synergistaceae bacterium]
MIVSRHSIYVGLTDSDEVRQKNSTKELKALIDKTCRQYHVNYTMANTQGGFWKTDDYFMSENSLVINLIGADDAIIEEIASDVCVFLNQEFVMVVKDEVDCHFIENDIRKKRKQLLRKKSTHGE